MQQHPADCLRGPVRRASGQWTLPGKPGDPDIRWELVERIRRQIAEGTYDTPEKMEKALERLVDDLD